MQSEATAVAGSAEDEQEVPAGGADIDAARRLAEKTPKTPVDHDDPEGSRPAPSYGSHLPGVGALGMIQHLTPFLFFYRIYANALYPRYRTPEARMVQFKKDHKAIFWIHWGLDFLLQLVLVAAVVLGVSLIAFNGIVHTFKLG
ncbi:hypothetical protein LFT45_04300 [Arthrobacter sp. FW305-BF8]|uniref:hypothetical protein n=1 Tax=Arthrobacter sp. FW305-BF8 TaxID=2879617 RepID=UPI001F37B42E|nr:hypothetical protein [Arthrobacter sp. FW305-BF8]UKA55163.1 hypothetical protein LFT45_04300 [Arthrobacter sp. FW305-BF8]